MRRDNRSVSNKEVDFRHDTLLDSLWRAYGLPAYVILIVAAIGVTPSTYYYPQYVLDTVSIMPAIDGLLKISNQPAKLISWVVVSLLLYPIFHASMRARVHRIPKGSSPLIKVLIVALAMDAVLIGGLAVHYSEEMRSIGGSWIRIISNSGVGLAILGPAISVVYSLAIFLTIQVLILMISKQAQESNK